VDSDTAAVATRDLPCDNARGVRINLEHNGKEIVRLASSYVPPVESWIFPSNIRKRQRL
jgi:hypothetical protein